MEGIRHRAQNVRVDVRLGQGHIPAAIHQPAPLEHHLHVDIVEVVQHGEVRQIPGGNGALVVQEEVAGSVVTGHLDGQDGIRAQMDGLADDVVDVSLVQQIPGVLVVGGEHAAVGVLLGEQGHQGLQVLGGGALADHDKLSLAQLLQGILKGVALMVGIHPGGDVRVQGVAAQAGRMAVDLLVMGLGDHDLLDGGTVAMDNAGVVHHFRQAQHPGMVEVGVDVPPAQLLAVLLKGHGRHAGGQHEMHIQGKAVGGGDHVVDAAHAADVGDLMGIGDDGGGAVGNHRPGKGRGRHQGALQVNVRVDKAGGDHLAGDVHLLDAAVIAHAHHQAAHHGDIALAQLVGEHVDIGGVLQHQVSLLLTHGHPNHPLLFADLLGNAFGSGFALIHRCCAPFCGPSRSLRGIWSIIAHLPPGLKVKRAPQRDGGLRDDAAAAGARPVTSG